MGQARTVAPSSVGSRGALGIILLDPRTAMYEEQLPERWPAPDLSASIAQGRTGVVRLACSAMTDAGLHSTSN